MKTKEEIKKPITWKEFRKLHKEKKVHTQAIQIKKYGILLTPDDVVDFENESKKTIKKDLKELFNEFLEENF